MAITDLLKRRKPSDDQRTIRNDAIDTTGIAKTGDDVDETPVKLFRARIFATGLIVSLGGLIFGFDTGASQLLLRLPSLD